MPGGRYAITGSRPLAPLDIPSLGLILVFTGPFILLYADRVRSLFLDSVTRMSPAAARRLILIDAALRVGFGLFMSYAYAHAAGF